MDGAVIQPTAGLPPQCLKPISIGDLSHILSHVFAKLK